MFSIVIPSMLAILAVASGAYPSPNQTAPIKHHQTTVQIKLTTPTILHDRRYYIQYMMKANWYLAANFCRYNNMHLASVNSREDQLALEKQIDELGLKSAHFWMSGNDLSEEGNFSWASNGRPIIFARWWDNQPDNSNDNENCVEISEHVWNDCNCQNELYFICE